MVEVDRHFLCVRRAGIERVGEAGCQETETETGEIQGGSSGSGGGGRGEGVQLNGGISPSGRFAEYCSGEQEFPGDNMMEETLFGGGGGGARRLN